MSFLSLPLELHEDIATFIGEDKDLCNYMLICSETHNAVHSRRGAVWRALFADRYDLPPGWKAGEIMIQYIKRRMALTKMSRQGFKNDLSKLGIQCVEVLRDLVNESFAGASGRKGRSKNIDQLRYFAKSSSFLDEIIVGVERTNQEGRAFQAIQLILSHLQLDLSFKRDVKGFGEAQRVVYSHPRKAILFLDKKGTINIEHFLHVVNFFKHHMKTETENTLYPLLCDLDEDERPSAWERPLTSSGSIEMLGRNWKGSYAYIPDVSDLRLLRSKKALEPNGYGFIADAIDYDEGFQTLHVDPIPASSRWPATFENLLKALPSKPLLSRLQAEKSDFQSEPPTSPRRSDRGVHQAHILRKANPWDIFPTKSRKKTQKPRSGPPSPSGESHTQQEPVPGKDYLHFTGSGRDVKSFSCSGILHDLPAQCGTQGWQRVSLIKYRTTDCASSSSGSTPASPSTASLPTFSDKSSSASVSSIGSDEPMNAPQSNATRFNWNNSDEDNIVIDEDCWCYEGVVIPGGKMILGRWWYPLDTSGECIAMGPFIFWNTS